MMKCKPEFHSGKNFFCCRCGRQIVLKIYNLLLNMITVCVQILRLVWYNAIIL